MRIQKFHSNHPWLFNDIFFPFVISRVLLLLVGWFSQYFPNNVNYPIQQVVERGWQFTPHRLLDIWGRWDTGWYLKIVTQGYLINNSLASTQSNLAFFPLYPYLVRGLKMLLPVPFHSQSFILLVGVIVSNILFLAALFLLWKLIKEIGWEDEIARRSVFFVLLFPTGFIFSCFYSEATFLCLSVAAFYAAVKKSWAIAGLLGGLLALTRPLGILILAPITWLYLDSIDWNIKRITWNLAWLMLVPAAFFAYLLCIYYLTGDFLAPLTIQSAWNRSFTSPWVALINSIKLEPYIAPFDLLFTLGFFLLGVYAFFLFRSKSYGVYIILLVVPTLFSGLLQSNSRYMSVIFPAFIVLASLSRHRWVKIALSMLFFTLQVLFMAAWSQFYWAV